MARDKQPAERYPSIARWCDQHGPEEQAGEYNKPSCFARPPGAVP